MEPSSWQILELPRKLKVHVPFGWTFAHTKTFLGIATGGTGSLKGTAYWMAPEVIKQKGHDR